MLDLGRIKKKQKDTETKRGGGYWKPQEGRNTIRVFTFDHKVTKEDVKNGFFDKEKLGKTVTELDRQVVRFFPKGGRPSIATEDQIVEWRSSYDKANKEKQAVLRQSGPQTHWMLNIVDTGAEVAKIVEFAANKTVYNRILNEILDPDHGEDILGCEGRDFVVEYDPAKEGSAKYIVKLRDEKKCEKLPDSLNEQVKDYYDPEVYASLGSDVDTKEKASDDEDTVEEDESDRDEKEALQKKKKSKDDEEDSEDEDLDDEDSDEDEEEDEKLPKGKLKKK